jgi:Flp pilus assembly protein TadG
MKTLVILSEALVILSGAERYAKRIVLRSRRTPTLTPNKRIVQHLSSTEGAEIAEAALVLPLVFMFLLGIVWFGRAFNIYSTIQQAAQQGALVAARSSCVTCAGGGNVPVPIGAITDTNGSVEGTIGAVMRASSLDTSQIKPILTPPVVTSCVANPPPCSTTGKIAVCKQVLLNRPASSQPAVCGVTVTFQYPFKFYLPFTSLNMREVVMTAQAQTRLEN